MNADEAWSRLAAYVRARRTERRMSQAQLGANSGTSETTVRHLEGKVRQTFSPETLQAISRALGWTHDSAERVMRGDEPEDTFAVSNIPSVPATNHDDLAGRSTEVQHRQPTNVAPSPEWEARFRDMQAEIRRIRKEQDTMQAEIDRLRNEPAPRPQPRYLHPEVARRLTPEQVEVLEDLDDERIGVLRSVRKARELAEHLIAERREEDGSDEKPA